tara:strand:+ start:350 stop:505 length:156 start_codon:yes stop_codon:yes gene_type:complete
MKDTMVLRGMSDEMLSRYNDKILKALEGSPSDKNLIRIENFIMKEFKRRGM